MCCSLKYKKQCLKMSQILNENDETDLSPANDTGSSVEGMVAVARIATKGSSVVEA